MEKDKPQSEEKATPEIPVEVEEGVTPRTTPLNDFDLIENFGPGSGYKPETPDELLLTEVAVPEPKPEPKPKAKPFVQRFKVTVPAGHVMPLGEVIKQPFSITIEAGVRWHPEWEGPQVTVNAYRFFHHGDALCWAGPKVLAFKPLLPEAVVALATYHGEALVIEGTGERNERVRILLERMGVEPPAEKQKLSDFVLPEQLGRFGE